MQHGHHLRPGSLYIAFGVFCLLAFVALGSGAWSAAPVSAQRSTVPTRTPTAAPATPEPTSPPVGPGPGDPAPTSTPQPEPTVAPATPAAMSPPAPLTDLPVVGAWVPAPRR